MSEQEFSDYINRSSNNYNNHIIVVFPDQITDYYMFGGEYGSIQYNSVTKLACIGARRENEFWYPLELIFTEWNKAIDYYIAKFGTNNLNTVTYDYIIDREPFIEILKQKGINYEHYT